MRQRPAGVTLIELIAVLFGFVACFAFGLLVASRGAVLLYLSALLFPPLGQFLCHRRRRAVTVVLLLAVPAGLIVAVLLAITPQAHRPTAQEFLPAIVFQFTIVFIAVYAFVYPFLVLWSWDSVHQYRRARRDTVARTGPEAAVAAGEPSKRRGRLSRPIVFFPTILLLAYVGLTVALNLVLSAAGLGPTSREAAGRDRELSVWSIRIGDANLAALKLTQDGHDGSIQAEAFDWLEYPKLLNQPGADPEAMVREAMTELFGRNESIRESPVCVVVPDDVARTAIIESEAGSLQAQSTAASVARRLVDTPADSPLILDFQILPAQDRERLAVCVAERNALQSALSAYPGEPFAIAEVHANGFALLNFLHREVLSSPGTLDSQGGPVMLFDMRSEETVVLITDGRDYWIDRIAFGTSHFTRALMERFHLTFPKAEHLRRNVVKPGVPEIEARFLAMRTTYDAGVTSIQGSLDRWSSEHPGATIRTIYGIGPGARFPGLRKYLSQKLRLPGSPDSTAQPPAAGMEIQAISKFAQLSGEEVLGSPQFQENLDDFATLYGSALQGLGLSELKISLALGHKAPTLLETWSDRWKRARQAVLLRNDLVLFHPVTLYLALLCVEAVWLFRRIRQRRAAGMVPDS